MWVEHKKWCETVHATMIVLASVWVCMCARFSWCCCLCSGLTNQQQHSIMDSNFRRTQSSHRRRRRRKKHANRQHQMDTRRYWNIDVSTEMRFCRRLCLVCRRWLQAMYGENIHVLAYTRAQIRSSNIFALAIKRLCDMLQSNASAHRVCHVLCALIARQASYICVPLASANSFRLFFYYSLRL